MPHVKLPLTDVVRSRGWYAKVRYVGAAGLPDPEPIAYAALCAGNLTASGFSILRLDRTAPEQVTTLIRDTVALPANGLSIPVPEVIGWDDLIAAHLSQSEGRAVGKTVLAVQ
jgi:NADPH:quinone reductase-like Zn-dependent oxidoreductase